MSSRTPRRRGEDDAGWLDRLALLGDLGRVRILRLLSEEELGVGELARALQWPQSTASRQLKPLHEQGWVRRRVDGTTAFYRMEAADLGESVERLWCTTIERLAEEESSATVFDEDDRRLREVLASRRVDSRSFFGRVGGEWDAIRQELFGSHWLEQAMLGLVPPAWSVADLGCGTGEIALRLAAQVRRVIAVDREPSMIEAAKARLASFPSAEVRAGDLLDLPIEDRELDAAVISLVLHHLPEPSKAIAEAARTLRVGGVLLVIDMIAHDREAYLAAMGHVHLGFREETTRSWADAAGLRLAAFHRLRPDLAGKGPGLFAATMVR
ncbi:MAG: ArsR/SmtB family transcription factor [Phycisphaerales bacterium]